MTHLWQTLQSWSKSFIKAGYYWWSRNHANEAAALAFYSLFSLIPMLLIGIYVASWIVGRDTATASLLEQTDQVTGFNAGDFLKQALASDDKLTSSKYPPLIGVIVLAFSATKVISQLRRALSNIFGNPTYTSKKHAAISVLAGRAMSLVIIISLGVTIASSVVLESILRNVSELLEKDHFLSSAINYLTPFTSLAGVTFLGTVVMRWLPKRPPKLREAFIGGIVCSILLVILKYGLILFLKHANISDLFGGAITLVLLLLWIYFVMQVILYSAEFTAILARERREKLGEAAKDENECTDPLPE